MSDSEEEVKKRSGKRLTRKMIGDSLSVLARTADGLGHAYVRAQCPDRLCRDIEHIREFPHLRVVELQGNRVGDLSPLAGLPQLLLLNLDRNGLAALGDFGSLEHLQEVSLQGNVLQDLGDALASHPALERVRCGRNKLTSFASVAGQLPRLAVLDARGNRLRTTATINDLPALRELYLAENRISKVEGLAGLPALEVLHLRGNRIAAIGGPPRRSRNGDGDGGAGGGSDAGSNDGDRDDDDDDGEAAERAPHDTTPGLYEEGDEPWRVFAGDTLVNLRKVNLRDCAVTHCEDLRGLSTLPALVQVSLAGCPVAEADGNDESCGPAHVSDDGYRVQLLTVLPGLQTIDKVRVITGRGGGGF
jgi:hypothetical protein